MTELAEINSFRSDIPAEIRDLSPALFDYLRELTDTLRVFGTAAVTGSLTLTERELTTRYYGQEYPLGVEAKARVNDKAVNVKFVRFGYPADGANLGKLVYLDSDLLCTTTGPDDKLRGVDFTKAGSGDYGWIQTQGVVNKGSPWIAGNVGDSVYLKDGLLTLTPSGLLIGQLVADGMLLSQGLQPHYDIPPDLTDQVTGLMEDLGGVQTQFDSLGGDLQFLSGLVENYNNAIKVTLARLESAHENRDFGALTRDLAELSLRQGTYELKLESITTEANAEALAARNYSQASANFSVTAQSGASQSGFWAEVADRHRLDAQAFSINSFTQATIATTQAASATASAASASASATLAATYTGGQAIPGLFSDPLFESSASPWQLPWMMTYRGGLGTGTVAKLSNGKLQLVSGKSISSSSIFCKLAQTISTGTQYYTGGTFSSFYKLWKIEPGSRVIVTMSGITTGLDRFRPKFYLTDSLGTTVVSSGYGASPDGSSQVTLTTTQSTAAIAFDIPSGTTATHMYVEFEGDLVAGGTNVILSTTVTLDYVHMVKTTQSYNLVPPAPSGLGTTEKAMRAEITTVQSVNASQDSSIASHTTTLSSQGADITTLFSTTSSHTSSIASMSTTLSTHGSSLTTQAAAITDLEGRTEAYWLVDAVAGGRAQLKVWADAVSGGGVDIIGDVKIDGSLLVSGSISTGKIGDAQILTAKVADDAVTDFTAAVMSGTLFGNSTTQNAISTNVVMAFAGDIVAIVVGKQAFTGNHSWSLTLKIDSVLQAVNPSGTVPGDSVSCAGLQAVAAGTIPVLVDWNGQSGCDLTNCIVIMLRRYK